LLRLRPRTAPAVRPPGSRPSQGSRDRGAPLCTLRVVVATSVRSLGASSASQRETPRAGVLVGLRAVGVGPGPRRLARHQRDAIDGTRRKAELAARATIGEHRVHELRGADDRIDGTGSDAQRATDARRLVDARERRKGERILHPAILPAHALRRANLARARAALAADLVVGGNPEQLHRRVAAHALQQVGVGCVLGSSHQTGINALVAPLFNRGRRKVPAPGVFCGEAVCGARACSRIGALAREVLVEERSRCGDCDQGRQCEHAALLARRFAWTCSPVLPRPPARIGLRRSVDARAQAAHRGAGSDCRIRRR